MPRINPSNLTLIPEELLDLSNERRQEFIEASNRFPVGIKIRRNRRIFDDLIHIVTDAYKWFEIDREIRISAYEVCFKSVFGTKECGSKIYVAYESYDLMVEARNARSLEVVE